MWRRCHPLPVAEISSSRVACRTVFSHSRQHVGPIIFYRRSHVCVTKLWDSVRPNCASLLRGLVKVYGISSFCPPWTSLRATALSVCEKALCCKSVHLGVGRCGQILPRASRKPICCAHA